ncbi:MAG: hypothetical protein ABI461_05820, partial [Polyangiaceae bacterium]
MSLFPSCTFRIDIPGGRAIPGERLEAALVLYTLEPIPRAEHIDLLFESIAWAGYGGGKSRTVIRRKMFSAPLHIGLPKTEPFAPGFHHYPFAIDLPIWLPPGYIGEDCAIEHTFKTHLDVDWAVDPKAELSLTISRRPQQGTRRGIVVRSPPKFDSEVVVEVTLESTVIAENEPIRGQIALRSGLASSFRGLNLAIATQAKIVMGRSDKRLVERSVLEVPYETLRAGEAVSFAFPPIPNLPTTFRSNLIDNDVVLLVSLDRPWSRDPRFSIDLTVLPMGSTLDGEGATTILGGERLRRLSAAMAQSNGLQPGDRAPTLAHGKIGSTALVLLDAPRKTTLGVDLEIIFPDVEIGLEIRERGFLDAEPTLLPRGLERYHVDLDAKDERPALDEGALRSFLTASLGWLIGATELRMSDHHLAAHVKINNDDEGTMVEVARKARLQAEQISNAITALPFPAPLAAFRSAWQATAVEQVAVLIPTGPTLHGLAFRARLADGEERTITATLRTIWNTATPTIQADVNLDAAPIPATALKLLENQAIVEGLVPVRGHFEVVHVTDDGRHATLSHEGWTEDPRTLLPALEAFFSWVLAARGERRVEN